MNELKIHGHSGCGLKVIEDSNGNLLVEKSCKESYVDRLKAQYVKQLKAGQMARSIDSLPFDTPYPSWTESNTMLMPYVNAMSFIEYFERATKYDIDNLIESLINYINIENNASAEEDVPSKKFIDKVESVYQNATKNTLLKYKDLDEVRNMCDSVISWLNVHPVLKMKIGRCHGDMTFSNILFRGSGRHALIDFLDSFVETPLQDIVKIRQDTTFGWSLLMSDASYNEAHVKTVLQYIDKKISQHFENEWWYSEYYDMLQFVNLLRIIPYVKNYKVFEILINALKTIKL